MDLISWLDNPNNKRWKNTGVTLIFISVIFLIVVFRHATTPERNTTHSSISISDLDAYWREHTDHNDSNVAKYIGFRTAVKELNQAALEHTANLQDKIIADIALSDSAKLADPYGYDLIFFEPFLRISEKRITDRSILASLDRLTQNYLRYSALFIDLSKYPEPTASSETVAAIPYVMTLNASDLLMSMIVAAGKQSCNSNIALWTGRILGKLDKSRNDFSRLGTNKIVKSTLSHLGQQYKQNMQSTYDIIKSC